jgi:N-methylhydantoinase A
VSRYRVAVDVGGTFTDFVIQDTRTGAAFTNKVLSTADDQARGVLTGLRDELGTFGEIASLVHGSTVGLNAFLERRGARVLFITTEGFRDVLRLGRGERTRLFALHYRKPSPLVPVTDVETVRERINADGSVRLPLDETDLLGIIRRIDEEEITSVAVCLLHSYRNPQHELRVRDILLEHLPHLSVSLSHVIAPEWREYERSSTTVLNAYIAPKVDRYLTSLLEQLANEEFRSTLHVMQCSGGVTTAAVARRQPVQTLLSGPVGGTVGGVTLAQILDRQTLICVDMGGTSFDASLVINGSPTVSTEATLEGLPLLVSLVDIHTIGAGGGSIAWIEAEGLRVGPHSAGSDPGPACYGNGGIEPTVTDANAVLGRIDPDYFLDGGMALDIDAAERAVDQVATPLGMSRTEAATGVLAIINAKMADALRTLTIQQGIDPRNFSLVAFGGAGPMHAVALAEELGINEIIVPWAPGAFSAWGMLHTDIRRDLVRSHYRLMPALSGPELTEVLDDLQIQGSALLETDGVAIDQQRFMRHVDMRYSGQSYTLTVELPEESPLDVDGLVQRFHDVYFVRYGHSTPGAPVETVAVRLAAIGVNDWPVAAAGLSTAANGSPPAALPMRTVVFDGVAYDAAIVRRETLGESSVVEGPAIIEEPTATCVVPPRWRGELGPANALIISCSPNPAN